MRQNNVGRQSHELFGEASEQFRIGSAPAIGDLAIATLAPTRRRQRGFESVGPFFGVGVGLGNVHEHADVFHRRLLRASRKRPATSNSTADKLDELAPFHSITSSAIARMPGGMVRLNALAVLRLITSSNLVGSCTGRSAGFSPRRMRST